MASIIAIAVATGCQTSSDSSWKVRDLVSLDSPMPWEAEEEEEPQIPDRVACAWTETVMTRPGQPPQRGFGGRLHFYGQSVNEPIPVTGQLVVYAFDETGRDPTDNRPSKRYVFPPDQFSRHRSDSTVGPSYSFWLPWNPQDGLTRDVSLICRFEPTGGPLVVSEQTRHRLQGTMLASKPVGNSPSASVRPHQVQQTGLNNSSSASNNVTLANGATELGSPPNRPAPQAAANDATRPRMKTTSISLPSSFRRK